MEATGSFPVSQGSEDAECLPVQVLETRTGKWMQGASMLQGISLKKRLRERKERKKKRKKRETRSDQASSSEAPYFYFQKGLYTFTCT